MSKICRNSVKDSSTTHQNEAPTALGVLNSKYTRNVRYKVDKGAWKACFMTKTLLKNAENKHKNTSIFKNFRRCILNCSETVKIKEKYFVTRQSF